MKPRLHEEVGISTVGNGWTKAIVTAVADERHPTTFRAAGSDGYIHDVSLSPEYWRPIAMTTEEAIAYRNRCACWSDQDSRHTHDCPIHNRFHPWAERNQAQFYREMYAYEHWAEDNHRRANRKAIDDFRRKMRDALPALYDPDQVAEAFVEFAQEIGKLPKEGP